MFEVKDIIGDAVRRALKVFHERTRGDTVTWGEIEETAGFDRESPHWVQFSKRTRRDFLRSTGIALWPVNGVGLQLLSIHDQIHMRSISRQRRAKRQMRRDIEELRAIPDHELSSKDREVRRIKVEQARQGQRAVLSALRQGHTLMRPDRIGLPRNRPVAVK